ncbi:hypothetical protein EDB92DRAFT_1818662 [Lactarius akahatsu]|uniref:Uncharacterized protein n=1 Tax=Lactarius akahatsu TaxID=416441 RepID=A0AAD4LA90_9AGAM|nr:hypothetical protein EDB92DRAFT_1818662 [Lactarius akahatsu]
MPTELCKVAAQAGTYPFAGGSGIVQKLNKGGPSERREASCRRERGQAKRRNSLPPRPIAAPSDTWVKRSVLRSTSRRSLLGPDTAREREGEEWKTEFKLRAPMANANAGAGAKDHLRETLTGSGETEERDGRKSWTNFFDTKSSSSIFKATRTRDEGTTGMLTGGVETALMGWGRDGVTWWAAPASRWWWGLCRDNAGAGRAMSRWWGRGAVGAGGGVEGAAKSLQEREVLPNRNG